MKEAFALFILLCLVVQGYCVSPIDEETTSALSRRRRPPIQNEDSINELEEIQKKKIDLLLKENEKRFLYDDKNYQMSKETKKTIINANLVSNNKLAALANKSALHMDLENNNHSWTVFFILCILGTVII